MSPMNESQRMEKLKQIRQSHIGHLFLHAFQAYDKQVISKLRDRGYSDVGRAHSAALRHLDFDGTRISKMAERAGITKQGMGQLVKDLVDGGYLTEEVDPDDRRAKLIKFTEEGFDLFEDVVEIFQEIEATYVDTIGARRMQQLKDTLRTILVTLDETDLYEFNSFLDHQNENATVTSATGESS